MPRAHRHFLPGQLWHITHRCHEKAFLLKFARDRRRYLRWLFEAKKRFGLCVLNYVVTSNHIHLLVKDTGEGVIASSIQLVAARTAQEYNLRRVRYGAFWEDRYHATAVEGDEHLHRCLVYIDLNAWPHGGYREIQEPPQRCALIEREELSKLCGFASVADFRGEHRRWVADALSSEASWRDARWSEAVAVGSASFVAKVKQELGAKARYRQIEVADDGGCVLQEPRDAYRVIFGRENEALRRKNTVYWTHNPRNT